MEKVSVVLPALCDDENVANIVPKLHALPAVDDIVVDHSVGLGLAVGHGIAKARNRVVAIMDCDGMHPIASLEAMIETYHDANGGSRVVLVSGSRVSWPKDTRSIVSYLGNWLARVLLRLKVRDCTTGFFVGSKDALVELPVWSGYGDFAIALHYEAKRRGWEVIEVPFEYGVREKGRTHTKLVRHSLQYLLRIRSLLWQRH